jgi:hypothetical protein
VQEKLFGFSVQVKVVKSFKGPSGTQHREVRPEEHLFAVRCVRPCSGPAPAEAADSATSSLEIKAG